MKTEQYTITNEDNMQLMSRYEDNHFDLAIVDPPYGIDVANMNMGAGKGYKCSKIENRKWTAKDWDIAPDDDYFKELKRVSKNQIIWGGNYFNLPPSQGFIVWDKCIDEQLSFSQCELAWISFQRSAKIFKESVYKKTDDKIHPTQKPIKLYEWLFKNYANEGDKILDTHLGSGSIAIALNNINNFEKMNLHLTACELDEDYFKASTLRIKQQTRQQTIF